MTAALAREPMIFVDLETTGANFINDRIIEIGVVEVDSAGVREWSSLINPEQAVSEFITQLTGIDSTMVSKAPVFAQVASEIQERLRGRLFVAHNARFDYTFLKREFKRLGIDFRAPNLCTVKLSRKLFPEHHRHNLDSLVTRFAIAVDDRHRALADARVLWNLWQTWHASLPSDAIYNAVDLIVGRPELPPHIDPAIVDDLPEGPGAYALYDADDKPLLIKRSTNLRQQVLAHFAPSKRDTAQAKNTRRVAWREAAGELGARLYELQLSAATRRPATDLCAWQLVLQEESDFRPMLVHADSLDFGRTASLYGLYSSPREATQALRKLADAHHLCYGQLGLGAGAVGSTGAPCIGYKQKTCRGLCVGKENVSLHSARLMTALAKFRIAEWPYGGPVALVERDEFGMREDFHVVDGWRYRGTAHNEASLLEVQEDQREIAFDPDIYRIVSKHLKAGKVRVLRLPASVSAVFSE